MELPTVSFLKAKCVQAGFKSTVNMTLVTCPWGANDTSYTPQDGDGPVTEYGVAIGMQQGSSICNLFPNIPAYLLDLLPTPYVFTYFVPIVNGTGSPTADVNVILLTYGTPTTLTVVVDLDANTQTTTFGAFSEITQINGTEFLYDRTGLTYTFTNTSLTASLGNASITEGIPFGPISMMSHTAAFSTRVGRKHALYGDMETRSFAQAQCSAASQRFCQQIHKIYQKDCGSRVEPDCSSGPIIDFLVNKFIFPALTLSGPAGDAPLKLP